ncbi:MAG TPA: hypothetical protein VMR37_00610 [Rhabdochlamydiaceae bacterium]|nr:hypothetical protein [Rhabdochlamydiaceae bacterium]
MKYVLETDDELVKALREAFPMTPAAIDRVKRSDMLMLKEAVLVHYEINPFSVNVPANQKIRDLRFDQFAVDGDPYQIVDLFRRSQHAGEVACLSLTNILEPLRRLEYAKWAAKKGLPLPECLTAEMQPWEVPQFRVVKDVQGIDWDNLPPSVLAALGANSFAQASKRADPKVKVPTIYRLQIMKKFLGDCAVAESKDAVKAEDTIREYIEHQFAD